MKWSTCICCISLLMLVNIQGILAQYLWRDTIVGFGIKPDIATHEATAYVAYLSETNPGFVKCAIIENTAVMTESVSNGYFYGPLGIKVDQIGNPRIVYHDHNTEDLGHAQRLESNWEVLRAENVGHDGWDGSIYIDNQNRSHVVSIDPNGGLEYAYRNDNEWLMETIDDSDTDYKFATSITGSANQISVSYHVTSSNELRYASKSNGSWIIETIAQNAIFPSLVLDQNDQPFVAYYQREDSGGYIAMATRIENQWESQKVEDIDDLVVNFTGARKIVDLELFNGKFHIAFSNKRKVRYGFKEGDNWVINDVYLQPSEQNDLGQQTSLDFNQEGMPVVTFYERDSEQEGGGSIHLLEAIHKDSSNISEEFIRFTAKEDNGEVIPNFSILAKDESGNTIEIINGEDTLMLSDLNANVASLCARKTDNPQSSLSAIDLVRMSKMVLNGTGPCKADFIAADVNRSGEVSALDIIQTLNIIIGNSNHFVENESWRFYPSDLDISNLTLDQIYENSCISIDEVNASSAISFSGVKLGDIKCNP